MTSNISGKKVFIEGFKDPMPIDPLCDILLSDLRGDGDNKLVLYDSTLQSLIVYRNVHREFQKSVDMNNVSGMICYYQENSRMPQPNIALSAENGLYIYRGMKESFRLRVPNLEPEPEQQYIWSQHQQNPDKLVEELVELSKTKRITESGKYIIGATSLQRKQELIKKAFTEGIVQKDSICAMAVIKPSTDDTAVGNVVLFTELKFMHILDVYGHSIVKTASIDVVVHQAFAQGNYQSNYTIVGVGRGNSVLIIENGKQRSFNFEKKAVSCVFDHPRLYILTNNQTLSCYDINEALRVDSARNRMEAVNKKLYSIKLQGQPIQLELMKLRSSKALLVALKQQLRIYNDRLLIYKLPVSDSISRVKFGTYGKQDGCVIIFYEGKGFEVKIMHRQFNPNGRIERDQIQTSIVESRIPVPKKSTVFQLQCQTEKEEANSMYRGYLKDMKLLKWRLLKEETNQASTGAALRKINVSSELLGLGPVFHLKLELENLTAETLYNVKLGFSHDDSQLGVAACQRQLGMMISNFAYPVEVRLVNKTEPSKETSLRIMIRLESGDTTVVSVVVPACDLS